MKKITRIISLLTLTAMLALIPDEAALTADASTPTTYSIAYVAEKGEWRYQKGSDFDFDASSRDADDIGESVENGDNIVIWGDAEHADTFKIPAYINNLTVLNASNYVVVYTNGINEFHACMNSIVAVNGDIQNAYVYDNSRVTFNNSIGTLHVNATYDESFASATCGGSVGRVTAYYGNEVFYDVYNVAWGKLDIVDVSLKTEAQYYSTTPTAVPAVAPAPAPAAPAQPAAPAASNDYDDVPKTGESFSILLLLGIAVASLAGGLALKKA